MELSFSRGFSPGWLHGCDHKMLVPGLSSAKRGVLLGEVTAIRGRRVLISPRGPVAPGDGIVFAGDREHGEEQGGRVYEVIERGRDVELGFGRDAIDLARLEPGQQIWKTDDPQLTARLRKTFSGSKPQRRVALDLDVTAAVGEPLANHRPGGKRSDVHGRIGGCVGGGDQAPAHAGSAGAAARPARRHAPTNFARSRPPSPASRWCR